MSADHLNTEPHKVMTAAFHIYKRVCWQEALVPHLTRFTSYTSM